MEEPKYLIFLELYYYLIKLKRAQICPFVATVKPRDAVADLKWGGRGMRPPPGGVQILSISCSFWEHLAKSYVGAPPGGLVPPPRRNPGSATKMFVSSRSNSFQLHATILVGAPV